ncbi:cytosolic sulfotransferase 16-like [Gossypium hirsutum]|uniref:Sulfotransferase n=1 Tax=Gossypium hirsutum TaxID=3635 RepID=A0ABM2ZT25_GOSHI|nr:cytosolic sulfotransferase 16-like [Gossypium hirsutum]
METSKTFPSVETPDEGYQKTLKNFDELLPTLPQTKDGSISFVDGIPSPRLLSTHLLYSLFPTRMTDNTMACRFLYVCRNPKDVLVSKWYFVNKLRPKKMPPLSLEETFDLFCKGYGLFWDHVLGYWKASVELSKKVLFLKYEDVKKEPLGCVRKVAEFLGVPFTLEEENKEIVEQIVKLCCFESMSNQDVNKLDKRYQQRLVSNSDFFRKGEVGDWVNHLSPEMAEKLDQITEQKLQDTRFNFH